MLIGRGDQDEALRILREEEPVFERLGDLRSLAITRAKIADVMMMRGDLNEALRIRTEEQEPVYERLGDVRGLAITRGQIADVLTRRGDLSGALRIRREEEEPVYQRLGDARSLAVTRGKIADIFEAWGNLREALGLWRAQRSIFENLREQPMVETAEKRIAALECRLSKTVPSGDSRERQ